MGIKQAILYCLLSVCGLLSTALSHGQTLQPYLQQDYLKAEHYLKKGQYHKFYKILPKLESHPLLPYLLAKRLRKQFYKTPIEQLDRFFKKYQGQPPATLLQRKWVHHLARQQKWQLFLDYYPETKSLTLRCNRITALHATHHQFDALTEGQELWLLGVSLPKACDKVFANWKRHGYLSADLIWQRLLNAQENRQYKLVRYLKKQLPSVQKKYASTVQKLWRRPHKILTDKRLLSLPTNARLVLMNKAFKYKPQNFYDLLEQSIFIGFDQEQKNKLERTALKAAALKSGPESYIWYRRAQKRALLDIALEENFLLGAVREANWPLYSHLYKITSQPLKNHSKWLYWQARALDSIGANRQQSVTFYELASDSRDFYGFLASQQLGISASMNHAPTQVVPSTLQRTRLQPAVKRAMAFLDMGRISWARREWQYAASQSDHDGHQALALIAGRLEWPDRAILTLAKIKNWHDLQLRFPLAHAQAFETAASRTRVSKHWLYGVARQESAFMYDAKSPVGATGLMQLMPSTARQVSRHNGLKYSKKRLLDPEYNIKLGSHYLQTLLKRYKGNRVLATAAYNAGPNNVRRWLKRFEGPLDIWIERIPFNETREYVQRVLTYSTIYSYRLGELEPILDDTTLTAWLDHSPNNLRISRVTNRQANKG